MPVTSFDRLAISPRPDAAPHPAPGKPGRQPGDKLKEIDGTRCTGLALPDVTRLLQGPENSRVALVLERGGASWRVDAHRLPPPSARGRRGKAGRQAGQEGGEEGREVEVHARTTSCDAELAQSEPWQLASRCLLREQE